VSSPRNAHPRDQGSFTARVLALAGAFTYFIEKKGWSVEQLLDARLTADEAVEIMRADQRDSCCQGLLLPNSAVAATPPQTAAIGG
jgi:hypothetical protein